MTHDVKAELLAENARRVYEGSLRARLESEHRGEFVAIEPESGDYYLGRTLSEAIQAARRGHPDRMPFAMRVGQRSTCKSK